MSASPVARIEQLDQIEKDVIAILQNAGQMLNEISKDRPSQKQSDQLCQAVSLAYFFCFSHFGT